MKYFVPAIKEQYNAQNTPKFKVGDWVYHSNLDQAYLITEFVSTNLFKASFGHFSDSGWLDIKLCTKATEEQIKDSLLEEAKKRVYMRDIVIGEGEVEDALNDSDHYLFNAKLDYIKKQFEDYQKIKLWIETNYKDKII